MAVLAPETIFPTTVDHTYVYPAPVDEPVPFKLTLGLLQSTIIGAPASAVGAVKSSVTTTLSVAVQPPLLFVTISV